MEDHEFVLGFVAFCLTPYKYYPIRQGRDFFLNESMMKINKMNQEQLDNVENKFKIAMRAAYCMFGKYAFRKIFKNHKKQLPLNKSLFEAWSVILSQLNNQELELLNKRKNNLIDTFINYIEKDEEFVKSISQAAEKVNYRFSTIEKIIQEVLS